MPTTEGRKTADGEVEVGEECCPGVNPTNTRLTEGLGSAAAYSYAALCATVLRSDFSEIYNE